MQEVQSSTKCRLATSLFPNPTSDRDSGRFHRSQPFLEAFGDHCGCDCVVLVMTLEHFYEGPEEWPSWVHSLSDAYQSSSEPLARCFKAHTPVELGYSEAMLHLSRCHKCLGFRAQGLGFRV